MNNLQKRVESLIPKMVEALSKSEKVDITISKKVNGKIFLNINQSNKIK